MNRKKHVQKSSKGNSFELLDEVNDDGSNDNATSSHGRPLKRTQPFEPNSPPTAKRANSTKSKATTSTPAPKSNTDNWARVEALLVRVEAALATAEHRAEQAEKRVEKLEEFIRNDLFPRIGSPPPPSTPASPPPSPPPAPPSRIPGVGIDLSRVNIPEIKQGNAGTVRKCVNGALKEKGITCLGVNSKGNGWYRLLFQDKDIDEVRRDDTWLK